MTKETMAWAISCENNPKGSKGQKVPSQGSKRFFFQEFKNLFLQGSKKVTTSKIKKVPSQKSKKSLLNIKKVSFQGSKESLLKDLKDSFSKIPSQKSPFSRV